MTSPTICVPNQIVGKSPEQTVSQLNEWKTNKRMSDAHPFVYSFEFVDSVDRVEFLQPHLHKYFGIQNAAACCTANGVVGQRHKLDAVVAKQWLAAHTAHNARHTFAG